MIGFGLFCVYVVVVLFVGLGVVMVFAYWLWRFGCVVTVGLIGAVRHVVISHDLIVLICLFY